MTPPPINVRVSAETDAALRALVQRLPALNRHRLASIALELGVKALAADPMRALIVPAVEASKLPEPPAAPPPVLPGAPPGAVPGSTPGPEAPPSAPRARAPRTPVEAGPIAPDEEQAAARAEVLAWREGDPMQRKGRTRTNKALGDVCGRGESQIRAWLAGDTRLRASDLAAVLAHVRGGA